MPALEKNTDFLHQSEDSNSNAANEGGFSAKSTLKDCTELIRVNDISEINSTSVVSAQNILISGRKHLISGEICGNFNEAPNYKKVKCKKNESTVETARNITKKELKDGDVQTDIPPSDTNKIPNSQTNPVLADIKIGMTVKKEEATSASRESCKFGISCYRRNLMHKIKQAHPGDHDYKRQKYSLLPAGTVACPYGDACYRHNPTHFQHFSHPPETDFDQNWENYRQRRQRTRSYVIDNSDAASDSNCELSDYDLDDPFIDDAALDKDYVPSEEEDDEKDDDCD